MKKRYALMVCLLLLPTLLHPEARQETPSIYPQFIANQQQFQQQVQQLVRYVQTNAPADTLRAAFLKSREAYKRIEWLLSYYQPYLADHLNGPPVAEIDNDEPGQQSRPPTGLQVVEPYLFPQYDPAQKTELLRELNVLLSYAAQVLPSLPADRLREADVPEAVRQQLFRMLTLGITGYDAPEAQSGLTEAAVTLATLEEVCRPYVQRLPPDQATKMHQHWTAALTTLAQATDFDTFDRVTFIRDRLYPLCRALQQAWLTIGLRPGVSRRFLSPYVATLSDSGAFQPDYISAYSTFVGTPEKAALGKVLFFDPLLSGNNARSCASCHQPERAFTDGRTKSRGFGPLKRLPRNTPTLLNAGMQRNQFYDSRVVHLEEQILDVLTNTHELHTSAGAVADKLAASSHYKTWFSTLYPDGLTVPNIRNALACYVRSLNSLRARPDRYLLGENVALTPSEHLGFNLFLGKARCATCHFFPIYNGFVPPHYEKTESEILGVPRTAKSQNARIDPDLGRFNAFGKTLHRYAFKTPTVRNVALTAPYMHNGVYKTLEEVVDFYNRGGGRGIGIDVEGQTLPPTPLNLSQPEQQALVAFLNALTDTTGLTQRPQHLPRVDGRPAWNRRKPGGRY